MEGRTYKDWNTWKVFEAANCEGFHEVARAVGKKRKQS